MLPWHVYAAPRPACVSCDLCTTTAPAICFTPFHCTGNSRAAAYAAPTPTCPSTVLDLGSWFPDWRLRPCGLASGLRVPLPAPLPANLTATARSGNSVHCPFLSRSAAWCLEHRTIFRARSPAVSMLSGAHRTKHAVLVSSHLCFGHGSVFCYSLQDHWAMLQPCTPHTPYNACTPCRPVWQAVSCQELEVFGLASITCITAQGCAL